MKASERFTTASGEKAHNITALISPQQPRGPSMETWIKGISPVAVYISLIVPASPSSQSIHYLSGYCSSPPSWWWGLTKKKKRRKRLLKTGAVEQSLETPPRLDPPVQEHDLLLGFYEACSVNTNSLALFFFLSMRCLYLSVLMSTNMLWQPEAKQFPMKKNLIRNIHFAVGLRDSSSEATRRDQIKPLQGESWDKHMYWCTVLCCVD